MTTRSILRLIAGAVVAAGWIGAVAAEPAAARVVATGRQGGPGTTVVTFTIDQGCAGAPTTSLKVRLPEGAAMVTPEVPPGWAIRTAGDDLEWLGGSLADGEPGSFVVSMRVPGVIGDIVYLPAVQSCGSVQQTWTEPVPDAQAEHAAPRVELEISYIPAGTAPGTTVAGPPTSTATTADPATSAPPATAGADPGSPVSTTESAGPPWLSIVLTGLVVAGLLVGVIATVRFTRRSDGSSP